MPLPDRPQLADDFHEYLNDVDQWEQKLVAESEAAIDQGPRVTAHDIVIREFNKRFARRSTNVEDRRGHKERGKLYRLDTVTGEELPPAADEFVPKAQFPAGDPRWHTNFENDPDFDPNYDMAETRRDLSKWYQETIEPREGEGWRKFKAMIEKTKANMFGP